jgi:hypothetical protein
MSPLVPAWLPDALLDDDQRALLRRFVTPRRGLDGGLLWPTSELEVAD